MVARKSNKIFWWVCIICVVILLPTAYFVYTYYQQLQKSKPIKYKALGISIPAGYTIHGIDVSSHQNNIDWPSVKEMQIQNIRIGFAFIKATEGLNDVDKRFHKNWQGAQENQLTKGAYLYFLATKNGTQQANNFIKEVALNKGDLPPVVDVEELYGARPDSMRARLKKCLQRLEEVYKTKPIIYSYAHFYTTNITKEFEAYPLWIAHYFEPNKPNINRPFTFWQHSDAGRVNGIGTPVDYNIFNGDSTAFKKLLLQ